MENDKKTTVLSLYGGPGTGKSTLAAAVYAHLKRAGYSVELVREWIKSWAYAQRPIGRYDQLRIAVEQATLEEQLLGKVDYIVTDSPLLLPAFYEQHYFGTPYSFFFLSALRTSRLEAGYRELNFLLPINPVYQAEGRYETKEQATALHAFLYSWLEKLHVPIEVLTDNNVGQVLERSKL